jgi:hypothetical protein
MTKSEVARLREQIALEYEAANRVFTDFTPTARHEYITKREENIASYYEELKKHVSPEEAIGILVEAEHIFYEGLSSSGNTS